SNRTLITATKKDEASTIKIQNQITEGQIDEIKDTGLKIWIFSGEYVFVSTDLKKEFQKITKDELEFTIGFSDFAGTQTGSRWSSAQSHRN
ncbi:MAG: hypothetical protein LW841_15190, partial [Flammeovirgaceae bacterium]|nr:hypothetical protein [Flammeovirgaceae bacterium]